MLFRSIKADRHRGFHLIKDLFNGVTTTGTNVIDLAYISGFNLLECTDMGAGKIRDVNVIADTGPISRWVIGSKYLRLNLRCNGVKYSWNEIVACVIAEAIFTSADTQGEVGSTAVSFKRQRPDDPRTRWGILDDWELPL